MSSNTNIGRWLAGLAAMAVAGVLLWYFRSTVVYILISAVLAIIGGPLVRLLSRVKIGKFSLPRWASALVTLVVMWVVLVSFCLLVVPLVVGKVTSLTELDLSAVLSNIQQPLEHVQHYISSLSFIDSQPVSLTEILVGWMRKVLNYDTINAAFSSVVDITMTMAVAFFSISFITFFFMKEDDLFFSMIRALFPDHHKEHVTRALNSVTRLLSRYFAGLLAESGVLMLTITLVMMLFGMKAQDAAFIGLIMGVMNVIPYAGPLIGGMMAVFMGIINPIEGATVGHTVTVIICSILTIKGIDDFIIQPTIYSDRVNAHPLEVFIVILLAGSVGGILGMLLAIPSYTVLRVFAKEFFSQYTLVKNLTKDI
mgnify:CR=1 FL=1